MTKKTTVIAVNKNSKCVRTVIPQWIASLLELQPGQKIVWELEGDKKNGFYAVMKRDD
jgi:hypothetical protein|tara:strand:+ start:1826 stop:1999 length:174 start_codon:yes stop_codon:yes gene_type:complete